MLLQIEPNLLPQLNYSTFKTMLTKLGCLKEAETAVETSLCFEAWSLLRTRSDNSQRINTDDFKGFLCLVLRLDRTHEPFGELKTSFNEACGYQKKFQIFYLNHISKSLQC